MPFAPSSPRPSPPSLRSGGKGATDSFDPSGIFQGQEGAGSRCRQSGDVWSVSPTELPPCPRDPTQLGPKDPRPIPNLSTLPRPVGPGLWQLCSSDKFPARNEKLILFCIVSFAEGHTPVAFASASPGSPGTIVCAILDVQCVLRVRRTL
jgi:hypothetical protein